MGASKPFWKFTAGYTTSKNMVQVGQAGISGNTVNASIEAFYAFTLTWNKPKRTLTLSPRR
jgi:outer membrane receptor for ferric coprogen and ferric-rhodotorulic acid